MRILACSNFTIFSCCRIGVALHVVLALVSVGFISIIQVDMQNIYTYNNNL